MRYMTKIKKSYIGFDEVEHNRTLACWRRRTWYTNKNEHVKKWRQRRPQRSRVIKGDHEQFIKTVTWRQRHTQKEALTIKAYTDFSCRQMRTQKNKIINITIVNSFQNNKRTTTTCLRTYAASVRDVIIVLWDWSSQWCITARELKCYNWMDEHTMYRCPTFLALPINGRLKKVYELKLCKNC